MIFILSCMKFILPILQCTAIQVLHNVSPFYLQGLFSYAIDVTSYNGRNPHRLYVPGIRTKYGKTIWCSFDMELLACCTI